MKMCKYICIFCYRELLGGGRAVQRFREEWASEGKLKGVCSVGETESVLRDQIPAYSSTHKEGA